MNEVRCPKCNKKLGDLSIYKQIKANSDCNTTSEGSLPRFCLCYKEYQKEIQNEQIY